MTKVLMATDGLGDSLHFLLSDGNRRDICMAQGLLKPFNLNGKLVLANKGYDSDKFVKWVVERGGASSFPAASPRNIASKPIGTLVKNAI